MLSAARRGALSFACAAVFVLAMGASSAGAAETVGGTFSTGGCTGGSTPKTFLRVQTASPDNLYAAPFDGVITSWSAGPDGWQTSLRVVRVGSGSSFTVVGGDGPRTGDGTQYPVRIPVRTGDVLGLWFNAQLGCIGGNAGAPYAARDSLTDVPSGPGNFDFPASAGSRVPVAATIEPDTDNDGYGDETQDGCPNNPTTGPCPLPTTLGKTFVPHNNSCEEGTFFPLRSPAVVSAVQREGVITSWSHRTFAGASGTAQLRILQPLGGDQYLLRAQDVARPVAPDALNTFNVRIPVRVGDRIAISVTGPLVPACGVDSSQWQYGSNFSNLALGASGQFDTGVGSDVDLSAFQEADADKDGFGDTTQDKCPTDATTQGTCAVDPPPVTQACTKARAKLKKTKAKLAKLKKNDAPAKKVKAAKKSVKKAKAKVRKAC